MKTINITFRKLLKNIIPIGVILFGVSSCTTTQTASRTNDGIYYNPSQGTEQEVVYQEQNTSNETYSEPIRIGGKYFDDQGEAPEETYEDSPVYKDNRVVINTNDDDDYIQWGNEGDTIVNINHYGSSLYSPYYPYPYYRNSFGFWGGYSFGFGWGGYYGAPFYPYGFYGPIYPYYGFGYPYHWYRPYPYYHPYYNHGYFHNGYHPNTYMRNVKRGRGNTNQVSTASNRNSSRMSVAEGIRRSDKTVQSARNRTMSRRNADTSVKRRDTDKVRVRRTPVRSNSNNVGTYSRPRTNNQGSTRPSRPAQAQQQKRRSTDKVPAYRNSNPRSQRSSQGTYQSGSRRSSNFGGGSTSSRSSGGGIRR